MLTPAQEAEARNMYIRTQLSPEDVEHWDKLKAADAAADAAQEAYNVLQEACPHPLLLRETANKGNTGNWDRNDTYWTEHKCHMCDKRWTTSQSWQHRGGKHGHPNDEKVKGHDRERD